MPNKRVFLVPRRQKPAKLDSAKLSQTAASYLCSGCTCASLALCAASHSWAVCVTNVCHCGMESQRDCSWRDRLSNIFVVSVSPWLPIPSVDCNTHWTSWNLIAHPGVLATDLTMPFIEINAQGFVAQLNIPHLKAKLEHLWVLDRGWSTWIVYTNVSGFENLWNLK